MDRPTLTGTGGSDPHWLCWRGLALSIRDLLNILHDLEQGSYGFVSLGETWCDATSDVGKLVVTIMSGIAEFERKLITARCEEGIAKARANGKKFGRPGDRGLPGLQLRLRGPGAADVAADRLLIRVLKLSRSAQHHTLRIDAVNRGIWPHARD